MTENHQIELDQEADRIVIQVEGETPTYPESPSSEPKEPMEKLPFNVGRLV